MKKLNFLTIICVTAITLTGCSDNTVQDLKTTQNNVSFIKDNHVAQYEISATYQKQLIQNYLTLYFSPWHNPYQFADEKKLKSEQEVLLNTFKKNPGWQENKQMIDADFIAHIMSNINFSTFPNFKRKAITINATHLRTLPTDAPAFSSWKKESDAYPFDTLQQSHLNANLPLYVLHTTRDHAWKFVITPDNATGWIHSNDIAYVDEKFIQQWKKQNYILTLKDNIGIVDQSQHFYFLTRLGQIYPLHRSTKNTYEFLIATANTQQQAIIKIITMTQHDFAIWPLRANTLNIAQMANRFLGHPYGWGGLYGYRDCSSTTKDLFAAFAIWLPRNSKEQAAMGQVITLAKNDSKKKEQITQQGIPYFTLLAMPGHIGLYIGSHNQNPYIFNQRWGIRKDHWWSKEKNRFIIGRTVITALDFDSHFLTASSNLLSITRSMNVLIPQQNLLSLTEK